MYLSSFLSTLLGSVLVMLSVQVVESFPVVKRAPPSFTLPLSRSKQTGDIHGQIYLQLHINQASRRLARLTRRPGPTDEDLFANLERRIDSIEGLGPASKKRFLEKRINQAGVLRPTKPNSGFPNPGKGKKKVQCHGPGNHGAQIDGNGGGEDLFADLESRIDSIEGVGPSAFKKRFLERRFNQAGIVRLAERACGSMNLPPNSGDGNVTVDSSNFGGITPANPPIANNSLGLDVEAHDAGYIATIQLGTPPQDFRVLVDSGSGDLWVGADNCQADTGGNCGNHTFLGPTSSSPFVDTKAPFQITYGTGHVAGNIITDTLAFGNFMLPNHTLGVATNESVEFSSNSVPFFDGIMGLASSINSEQKTITPVEALAKAGLISEPIVSYKISRLADKLNDGEITFGGLDITKFDPKTLVSLPNINQHGLWEANLGTVSVNGNNVRVEAQSAILDTGTSLLAVPLNDANAIHSLINGSKADGQGGFTVPCTLKDKVALQFSNQTFEIDPRDIAFAPLDPTNPQGDCVSGIISIPISGINNTQWLAGDVFLKNAYFSTDVSKNTVTLAKLV